MEEKVSDKEKEEILGRVEQKAATYQRKYTVCGQTTLLALQEEFNLLGDSAVIKAAGFMGLGIARLGSVCGALLGGIMAMGLASGRANMNDPVYPEPQVIDGTWELPQSLLVVRKFYHRFVQEFGSWACRDLQIRLLGRSYETIFLEDEEEFLRAGGQEVCIALSGKAARLAAEAILELPRR